MEDDHNVCDYNVKVNDVILLMVKPESITDDNVSCINSETVVVRTPNKEVWFIF